MRGTHDILLDGIPLEPIPSLLDRPVLRSTISGLSDPVVLGRQDLDDAGLLEDPGGQGGDKFRVQGSFNRRST
jgi:hypothetical protein